MDYEIYCDESCIESLFDKDAHEYAVIGGIWLPSECRNEFKAEINDIKEKHKKFGELKWNKISPSSVGLYQDLIYFFFNSFSIRFRAICIEAGKLNHDKFNNGNGELGFYKFYFQLIQHWLYNDNNYNIFLDYKVNGYRHRVKDLQKILQNSTTATVKQTQALPSNESVLIQLADVLTGAVASKFNNSTNSDAKLTIRNAIEKYLGHAIMPTAPFEQKFNVFNINLRQGW